MNQGREPTSCVLQFCELIPQCLKEGSIQIKQHTTHVFNGTKNRLMHSIEIDFIKMTELSIKLYEMRYSHRA